MRILTCAAILLATFGPASAAPQAFLEKHCFDCHDSDTRKGGLDLTGLAFDLKPAETFATWVKVHDLIASGEMPPPKKPRPPEAERTTVTRELATALVAAERARLGGAPRTATRRLTRSEYENTVRDLFDMPGISVREFLPPDGSAHGFDNNADALDISHVNMASYMAAADHVLDAAIAIQPTAPAVQKQRMSLGGRGSAAFEAAMVGSCVLLKDKRLDPKYAVPSVFKHNEMSAHERLGASLNQARWACCVRGTISRRISSSSSRSTRRSIASGHRCGLSRGIRAKSSLPGGRKWRGSTPCI